MASMIRVLHLADIINRYDFIDNVLRYCDRGRFRSYACTFTNRSNIEAPVYTDVPRYILGAGSRAAYPRALAKLVAILQKESIDIVHTHHFDPMVLGTIAAGVVGCKVIVGRHYSDTVQRLANPWKRQLYLRAEAFCHGLAAKIIVPSTSIQDLLTRVQKVAGRKVVRIPYGFDLAKYVPSTDGPRRLRQQFAPDGQVLVACFARLHAEKGQSFLLRAVQGLLSAYPRVRVLLVGEGPDRRRLEVVVNELGMTERVVFAGWHTDVVDLLAAVDIVVHPSISGEGFSQAMVEALALGRALIATDVSGARDVVRHGENGFLVPPGDPDAIGGALRVLLDAPRLARQFGDAGREYVKEHLDIRRIVRQYEDCYSAIHAGSIAA